MNDWYGSAVRHAARWNPASRPVWSARRTVIEALVSPLHPAPHSTIEHSGSPSVDEFPAPQLETQQREDRIASVHRSAPVLLDEPGHGNRVEQATAAECIHVQGFGHHVAQLVP